MFCRGAFIALIIGAVLTVAGPGQIKVWLLRVAAGFKSIGLRAPAEIDYEISGRFRAVIKKDLRSVYSAFVRAAFLGWQLSKTFDVNYWLVARMAQDN